MQGASRRDGNLEPRQPFHGGGPLRELRVIVHDPGQRSLHLNTRVTGLEDLSERDGPSEVRRGNDHQWKQLSRLSKARSKKCEIFGRRHDGAPVRDDAFESAIEIALLVCLATSKRDSFDILSEPHQAEAKIRLNFLLLEFEPDQPLANQVGY
jgi:hypothetical protein